MIDMNSVAGSALFSERAIYFLLDVISPLGAMRQALEVLRLPNCYIRFDLPASLEFVRQEHILCGHV